MHTLSENGFDDIESLRFLDLNTLVALGVSNPQEVFDVVQTICNQYQEEHIDEEDEQENYEYDGQGPLGNGEMDEEDYEANQQPLNIEVKQPKTVTQALIVQTLLLQQQKLSNSAAAQKGKTMKGQHLQGTLSKLTHLHLNNKRLQRIGDEIEKYCKNLKVLYLFDNFIQEIDGIGQLKQLIQVSLYNNQIVKMQGFDNLVNLRKLYLEKNMIKRLEGLNACRQLEELYLSHQDIEEDFTFDDYSLASIAGSLKYLDLSEARVSESQPLYFLERLETLILKRNRIEDFEMHVCPMLQTMSSLSKLDLTDNPVNYIPKYRDQIIILTGSRLQEIDNKKVTQQERSYLMSLVQRKQRQVVTGGLKEEVKQQQPKAGFEIQGKNKTLHQTSEATGMMARTTGVSMGSRGGNGEEDSTQNQFYSPLDDLKNNQNINGGVFKQRTNIANVSYQNQAAALIKKKSINLNSNSDFTGAGISHMATKHVPKK